MNGHSALSSSAPPHGSSSAQNQRHGQHQRQLSSSPNLASGILHQPTTVGEWQLFTVLQRANLIQYYDTFISQGGDDVNQLLEAGEEEFLEIMALVGMASKPLHVRRLQKALQEYSINPAVFQLLAIQKAGTLTPNGSVGSVPARCSPSTAPFLATNPLLAVNTNVIPPSNISISTTCHRPTSAQPSTTPQHHYSGGACSTVASGVSNSVIFGNGHASGSGGTTAAISTTSSDSPGANSVHSSNSSSIWPSPRADAYDLGVAESYVGNGLASMLNDTQIQRLSECAIDVLRQTPDAEQKSMQNKKRISREMMAILELPMDSPLRLEEFRRLSAIYGRFRKPDKPLSLHEMLVNEAAARICLHRPSLLTRRDELFPLARLVVKEAGFGHVKSGRPNKPDQEDIMLDGSAVPHKRTTGAASANGDEADGFGSPTHSTSSTSQASPSTSALTISLSPPAPATDASGTTSAAVTTVHKRQKRRLEEIGMELQRINAEQEACKRRVGEAQEMTDIRRELHDLTRRHVDLSDEPAKTVTEGLRNQAPTENSSLKCTSPAPHAVTNQKLVALLNNEIPAEDYADKHF